MVTAAAAVLLAASTWFATRALLGGKPVRFRKRSHSDGGRSVAGRPTFQIWLSQAGAAVTPAQFWAVSAAVGAATFMVLFTVTGAAVVAGLPGAAAAAAPYAYWAAQRRRQAASRDNAWPDAVRQLVGMLAAGIATLHEGLEELARSGPGPLRPAMSRYSRLANRIGPAQALDTVRSELADAISDPVLIALAGAVEEGTSTALRVLSDLGTQITADIQLAERTRTLQTQSRMATWGCFGVPYLLLLFLCATNAQYRDFFEGPVGLLVVLLGFCLSFAGLAACRRLVRPLATTVRVFPNGISR